MIVLLCAVAIGQVRDFRQTADVTVLRDRYEKAQAAYEKIEESYTKMQTQYAEMCERTQRLVDKFNKPEALLIPYRAGRSREIQQRLQASRDKLHEMQVKQHLRMQTHLKRVEAALLRYKQRAAEAKWEYERVAGRLREHWA